MVHTPWTQASIYQVSVLIAGTLSLHACVEFDLNLKAVVSKHTQVQVSVTQVAKVLVSGLASS